MLGRETLLVAAILAGSPASLDCPSLERAFEHLLESSFEVERTFRMSVNGDLKKRERVDLAYSEGVLETNVLEDDVLSKSLTFDADGKDFILHFDFSCERVDLDGEGRYELTSGDGLEVATLTLDDARGALRPVNWRLDTTERFLFKKFVIEGRAEYHGFRWLEAED